MPEVQKKTMTTDEMLAFGRAQIEKRANGESVGRRSDIPLRTALVVGKKLVQRRARSDKTLEDLFYETLKDIYYAERQIVKALPKMARGAQDPKLKAAFETHKEETEGQIERLKQVFELIGKRAQGKTCDAIEGILSEGEEILEEFKGTVALDAGLMATAQAVEHYEISRYGTLRTWAQALGLENAALLLGESLSEETRMDDDLTALASDQGATSFHWNVA